MSEPETRIKATCPDMPRWLQKAQRLYEEDHAKFSRLPDHIRELYSWFLSAQRSGAPEAREMAKAFEAGGVPSGPDMVQATTWHRYAAELGSSESAMRLAKLLEWQGKHEESAEMALLAIQNAKGNSFSRWSDWGLLASAAVHLLKGNQGYRATVLIEEMVGKKEFYGHPDYEAICRRLRHLKSQKGDDTLSLMVVQTKIIEDPEFKVGIYKELEQPLPLVMLPNPDMVMEVLKSEFPWFSDANALIHRQLVVQQYSSMPGFKIRPLLLAGPPGTGKTTWAKRLAGLCGVPFRMVMAGGGADSMYLRGTSRGWSTARPGAVVQTMVIEGMANPLFLIDELDKASPDPRNGRIWDVLLQLLEPASSKQYLDECLGVPCDLSWVSWIATANEIGRLPKPLLERFTVIVVHPPGDEHFTLLVNNSIKAFADELGFDQRMLPLLDADDMEVLRRCNGPREINRMVRMILEKRIVEDGRNKSRNLTPH